MSTVALERPSLAGRFWGAVFAAWGGFIALLPHVLHHVGPLAGARLPAAASGRLVFAIIGFGAAIPLLRRIYRRFKNWRAPAIALAASWKMFSLSSFVAGRRSPAPRSRTSRASSADTRSTTDMRGDGQ